MARIARSRVAVAEAVSSRKDAETPPMMKRFAFAALMIVCAGSAFAGADRPDWRCDADPEVTGSLHPSSERSAGARMSPAEEGWRGEFGDEAEQHWQNLLACGVD